MSYFLILLLLLIQVTLTYAAPTINLPRGVTSTSHDVYALHMTVIIVCLGIGVIVFGAMLYSIVFHRKSKTRKPAIFHENLKLEILWTILPFLILVSLAIPGTRVLAHMNNYDLSDLTIKVTGYQWKWRYEYLDQDIHFFSNISTPIDERLGKKPKNPNYLQEVDHPLIVPIHKKIRFLITSNDVLHAWAVPAIAIKREAIPGYINEAWARIDRPGVYRGHCTELCGINHAYMPIVIVALSEKEFDDWLKKQKGIVLPTQPVQTSLNPPSTPSNIPITPTTQVSAEKSQQSFAEVMKQGEKIYLGTCAACHQPSGEGLPPLYPSLKGSAMVKGPLPPHLNRVLYGKPGTAMQAFKDQLNDDELAAVITYERNAWGNNNGKIVTPNEVKTARNKGKE